MSYYPTPQVLIKLKKDTENSDGSLKDGTSKNAIINKAMELYYRLNTQP